MSGLVSAGNQIALVVVQIALFGGAAAVLSLDECVGILIAVDGSIGIQIAGGQLQLLLLFFGKGEALGLGRVHQRIDCLRGRDGLLDEAVGPGLAGLLVNDLLIQSRGGINTVQVCVVAVGAVEVVQGVHVVIAELGIADLVITDGGSDGVLLMNAAGGNVVRNAGIDSNCDHHDKNGDKGDGVNFEFLSFLLLRNLTLGHLGGGVFTAKLLFAGCAHEIISSHCSLIVFVCNVELQTSENIINYFSK